MLITEENNTDEEESLVRSKLLSEFCDWDIDPKILESNFINKVRLFSKRQQITDKVNFEVVESIDESKVNNLISLNEVYGFAEKNKLILCPQSILLFLPEVIDGIKLPTYPKHLHIATITFAFGSGCARFVLTVSCSHSRKKRISLVSADRSFESNNSWLFRKTVV